MNTLRPEVLIVGAGPAGLSAARALSAAGTGQVLLLDREADTGGIPRLCDHQGFGVRDLHRTMNGPSYARRLSADAADAGADIRTEATVTSWSPEHGATVTTPDGLLCVQPRATILATGARERPRAARMIPGDRPRGVYTTGQLQNLVHRLGGPLGERAVVAGAQLVSWSAVLTLRHAGCATALMVTTERRAESYAPLVAAGRHLLHVPVVAEHAVVRIVGRGRLEAVEIEHVRSRTRRMVACDTLVLTGDWVPDHELGRLGGLVMDAGSKSPLVDNGLRTTAPGVFAVGNLVHPVDTADVAALDGRHVAQHVRHWLATGQAPAPATRLVAAPPLRWVAPGLLRPGDGPPARHRYLSWSDQAVRHPRVVVRQDGRILGSRRLAWAASPGRVFRIPASLFAAVTSGAGDVEVGLG